MNKNKNDLKLCKAIVVVFTVQLCNNLSHEYVHLVSTITYTGSLTMYTEALKRFHFEEKKIHNLLFVRLLKKKKLRLATRTLYRNSASWKTLSFESLEFWGNPLELCYDMNL